MLKTLITGQKGSVGSVLFNLYKQARQDIEPLDLGCNVRAQRILHLAAKSPPASAKEIVESNIIFLQRVIDYAVSNDIKEIFFFSAISIYGNPDKEDLNEQDPITNPSLYGVSKFFGEALLENSPVNVLSLRFPAILSFGNTTNFISRSYSKLKNNETLELTNARRISNNFISIENIFGFLREVKLKKKFDVVNLASRKEKTLLEIVSIMRDLLDSKSKIEVSYKNCNFFNISTKKVEKEYNFIPYGAEESLRKWIEKRKLQKELTTLKTRSFS